MPISINIEECKNAVTEQRLKSPLPHKKGLSPLLIKRNNSFTLKGLALSPTKTHKRQKPALGKQPEEKIKVPFENEATEYPKVEVEIQEEPKPHDVKTVT